MPPKISQKLTFFIIAVAIGLVFFSLYIGFINRNRISQGVSVANANISGSSYEAAKNKIQELIAQKKEQTIEIKYADKNWVVLPSILGINLEPERTAEAVMSVGHGKNIFFSLIQQINSFIRGKNIGLIYSLDEQKFNNFIQENLSAFEKPAKNATLKFDDRTDDFLLVNAQEGEIFDREDFKKQLTAYLSFYEQKPIELKKITDKPVLTQDKNNAARDKAKALLSLAPYIIKNGEENWPIEKQILLEWFDFVPLSDPEQTMGVIVSETDVKDFLSQLAPAINKQPVNARLAVSDGKVVAFDLSQDGLELQIEESAKKISQEIQQGQKEISLAVLSIKPEISTQTIDTLGLTNLLGVGTSTYAGSPSNRVHNISVGAAKLTGILVKPGQEFSFLENIGEIEAEQGYLPELVIKNNKTIPEYGGGLCQISTTLFRAAVNAGLKITERFPHAFPVRYYNPQGFDATIYPPHPDLRFLNDTPGNILIQPKIRGTQLIFEIYGTKDGRQVRIIGPTILESNPDGSMKTVLYQEIWRDGVIERKDIFRSNYRSPALYPVERNPLE